MSPKTLKFIIKPLIWLVSMLPLIRLIWLGVHDDLGANPVEFVERSTGTWALVFLLCSLAITPISRFRPLAGLVAVRRLLGLWMFAYACLHVLSYLWLDYQFDWADIAKDILKHPFVLVGAAAFLLTVPLAATSNQAAMRRLKQRWKSLHTLVYLIAVLALLHYWWLVKKDVTAPAIYAGVFVLLMLARWAKAQARRQSSRLRGA